MTLDELTIRFSAIDARTRHELSTLEVEPVYSLSEQLFVEPEPLLARTSLSDDKIIKMTRPEIAVARSHIEVWKLIAASAADYALVLEDDIYIISDGPELIDGAWSDLQSRFDAIGPVDMLYVSYREAGPETEKQFVTDSVFRPVRGLWQLSGYVLSKAGAKRLLELLPVRGPVDLWINYQFEKLNVFATARSAIDQRPDATSDNVYSILPVLSTAGILSREKPNIFKYPSLPRPVFAWGAPGSGADELAMALSMLGYRCCCNVSALPTPEHKALLQGKRARVFDAYVNVEPVDADLPRIVHSFRSAKLIVTSDWKVNDRISDKLEPADVFGGLATENANGGLCLSQVGRACLLDLDPARLLVLNTLDPDKWDSLCTFLGCERPYTPYPCGSECRSELFAPTHS